MKTKRYDALVIGSGPAGSFAAKELTERGLDVILLEAGRNITEADFSKPPSGKHIKGIDVMPRIKAGIKGQPIQARVAFFGEQFSPFFVNDWKNPYSTPPGEFYLWIRGRQLGGRLHTYGRMLLRMTDYDFRPQAATELVKTGRSPTLTLRPGTTRSNSSWLSMVTPTIYPTCPTESSVENPS